MPPRLPISRINAGRFDGLDFYDEPPTPPPKDPDYIPKSRAGRPVIAHKSSRKSLLTIRTDGSAARPPVSRYASFADNNNGPASPTTPGTRRRRPPHLVLRQGPDGTDLPLTSPRHFTSSADPLSPRPGSRRKQIAKRRSRGTVAPSPTSPTFALRAEPSAAVAGLFSDAIEAGTRTMYSAGGPLRGNAPLTQWHGAMDAELKEALPASPLPTVGELDGAATPEMPVEIAAAEVPAVEKPVELAGHATSELAGEAAEVVATAPTRTPVRVGTVVTDVAAPFVAPADTPVVSPLEEHVVSPFEASVEVPVEASGEALANASMDSPIGANVEITTEEPSSAPAVDAPAEAPIELVESTARVEPVDLVEAVELVESIAMSSAGSISDEPANDPIPDDAMPSPTAVSTPAEETAPSNEPEAPAVTTEASDAPTSDRSELELEAILGPLESPSKIAGAPPATGTEDDTTDSDGSSARSSLLLGQEGGKSTRSSSLTIGDYSKAHGHRQEAEDAAEERSLRSASETANNDSAEALGGLPTLFQLPSRRSSCSSLPDKAAVVMEWGAPTAVVPILPTTATLHLDHAVDSRDEFDGSALPAVPATEPIPLQKTKRLTKSTPQLRADVAAVAEASNPTSFLGGGRQRRSPTAMATASLLAPKPRLPSLPSLLRKSRALLSPPAAQPPPALKRVALHSPSVSITSTNSSTASASASAFSNTMTPSYSVTCTSDGRASQRRRGSSKTPAPRDRRPLALYTPGLRAWDEEAFQRWEAEEDEASSRKASFGSFLRRGMSVREKPPSPGSRSGSVSGFTTLQTISDRPSLEGQGPVATREVLVETDMLETELPLAPPEEAPRASRRASLRLGY